MSQTTAEERKEKLEPIGQESGQINPRNLGGYREKIIFYTVSDPRGPYFK